MKFIQKMAMVFIITGMIFSCKVGTPSKVDEKNVVTNPTKTKLDAKIKNGYVEELYPNGNLSAAGFYRNGKANGLMKWYNENGLLVAEGDMVDGKRNGPWKICDYHDPSACIAANFNMEIREGLWKVYHENGQVIMAQNWVDDKPVSKICWDKDGKEIVCEEQ